MRVPTAWHPWRPEASGSSNSGGNQPPGMGMRSSSGAFNYSLRTIPPLVSFGDYISEYLFAASRSRRRPTPLFLFHRSLAIYPIPLLNPPFGYRHGCRSSSSSSTSFSSSSSLAAGCCLLVQESLILPRSPRNTRLQSI